MVSSATSYADAPIRAGLNTILSEVADIAYLQFLTGERSGFTPLIVGMPGTGKSAGISSRLKALAPRLQGTVGIWVVTLVDYEVLDVKGTPMPDEATGEMRVYKPAIIPPQEFMDAFDFIVIVIDEYSSAGLEKNAAANQIVLDYTYGQGGRLDPGKVFIVCAGNEVGQRSGAKRLPAHSNNRFEWMFVEPDPLGWADAAERGEFAVPTMAVQFLRHQPALFGDVKIPNEDVPYLTLRSFTEGMKRVHYLNTSDPFNVDWTDPSPWDAALSPANEPSTLRRLSQHFGSDVARQFIGYARVRHHLTPLDAILRDPEGAAIPTDFAASAAQAGFLRAWTPDTGMKAPAIKERYGMSKGDVLDALMAYAVRFPKNLILPLVEGMTAKNPACASAPVYLAYAKDNLGASIAMQSAAS